MTEVKRTLGYICLYITIIWLLKNFLKHLIVINFQSKLNQNNIKLQYLKTMKFIMLFQCKFEGHISGSSHFNTYEYDKANLHHLVETYFIIKIQLHWKWVAPFLIRSTNYLTFFSFLYFHSHLTIFIQTF